MMKSILLLIVLSLSFVSTLNAAGQSPAEVTFEVE